MIDEAQQWERTVRTGDPVDLAAFVAWIKRSPQHLEAYLQNLSVETEIERLDANRDFDILMLLTQTPANVVELTSFIHRRAPAHPRSLERRRGWRKSGVIAASGILLTCLTLGSIRSSSTQWTDYITETGEQRRLVLADGSIVELNTNSHIRVSMQPKVRAVNLLVGEALFNVKHDSTRPFRVRVGNQLVEDVGTKFSIYFTPDASTTVSVLDGRVKISSDRPESAVGRPSNSEGMRAQQASFTNVSAGEQIRIGPNGKLFKRNMINVSETASWLEHRLWFNGASLREVAAEFNRYNRRQLHIGTNPALQGKRYTGTFDTYDPESFVEALRDDPSLTVQSSKETIFVEAH